MRPVVQTILTSGIQPPIVLDQYICQQQISQTLKLGTAATITYTFQYCNDDPFASYPTSYNVDGNWINDVNAIGLTAGFQDGMDVPCRACRVNVASFVAGSTPTTFTVNQAGLR